MCPNILVAVPIEKSGVGVILIKCLTGSMLGIRPIYVTPHSHRGVAVAALIRGRGSKPAGELNSEAKYLNAGIFKFGQNL